MEYAFKIYIIGFIVCYIIWSCYFIKDSGELKIFLRVCLLSWLSIVINTLLVLKNYICNKLRHKYREKYWFCRIDNFNSIMLSENKRLALIDYLNLKLRKKGIHPYSDKGCDICARFLRRYKLY